MQAHCHMMIVEEFARSVEKQKSNPSIYAALTDLLKLYATYGIRNNAVDFLEVSINAPDERYINM